MSYAFFSEPVNGICEIMIRRTGKTAIGISTQEPLTDEQVQDLYWIVMAMSRTGKRLGELIGQKTGKGHWIEDEYNIYTENHDTWECSECHEPFTLNEGTPEENKFYFCPRCGADMR